MRRTRVVLAPCLLALSLMGCQAVVTSDVGNGIGAVCVADDECQASSCVNGLCTVSCGAPADCPAPSLCAGGLCELPLDVGMIYVGVPEDEGWTLTHEEGRQYAVNELAYLETDFITNTFLPEDALTAVDDFVANGAQVIVANSFSLREPIITAAEKYPDIEFLTCAGNVRDSNLGTYFGRMEQAWHLAGLAAAEKTTTNRLGFIGSFITPEVVRHINAFTLGARRVNPSIVVEVRWEGFWFDLDEPNADGKYNETVLAEQLLETGCDVIAHNMDNGRALEAVEEAAMTTGMDLFSIGNDNEDACTRGPNTCLGSAYWNWGPLYVQLFDQLHRKTWDPTLVVNENIKSNPAESTANFSVNGSVGGNDLEIKVSELLADLAKDDNAKMSLRGPYCSTGQRSDCVGDGEDLSDDELNTMCWFVEGVVEKANLDMPMSADQPAMVPQPDCDTQQ